MTRTQQWDRDTAIEQMASEFLDKNFYPAFSDKATIKRHSDLYHQFGGIDVTINSTNFDEKAKVKGCLNQVLEYIGLECSLLNKAGNIQDGWFLNGNLSTDFYAIIGLSASCGNDYQLTSTSQISAADVLWVKKSDIKDFISKYVGLDMLQANVEALREESDNLETDADYEALMQCAFCYGKSKDGKYRRKYEHGKFWLTYSSHMHEKPINLVIGRKTLESLPHSRHFIVTEGKVRKV